ncbi:hypothetical protein NDU88_007256 [Pleurodeles waltl]|uniref:Uncharacterized protein n=1 Tax=Pleurodeles waltl TaxID=8319 RepID=A0AAV7RUD3_PLEWA|nr:hypothetical protein NDU88_007256 [Pleurodeles waltl]
MKLHRQSVGMPSHADITLSEAGGAPMVPAVWDAGGGPRLALTRHARVDAEAGVMWLPLLRSTWCGLTALGGPPKKMEEAHLSLEEALIESKFTLALAGFRTGKAQSPTGFPCEFLKA